MHSRRTFIIGSTAILSLAAVLVGTLPAQAASSYRTLAAANIRSGPSTGNGIVTTVGKGASISIDCYINGQVISGTKIWDHLTSGGYISDSLLLTGSNSAVVPACSPGSPAPPVTAPSSTKAQHAVAWALAQNHSNAYSFACETFVENAYGTRFKYTSALSGFYALRAAGQIHYSSSGIPAGAIVFSSNPKYDLGNGHSMISVGNGTYISGGVSGSGGTVQVIGLQSTFLGWAYAPASWPGR